MGCLSCGRCQVVLEALCREAIHDSAAVAATYDTWLRINRMIPDVLVYFLDEIGVGSKLPVDRSIGGTLFTERPDQLAAMPSASETARLESREIHET